MEYFTQISRFVKVFTIHTDGMRMFFCAKKTSKSCDSEVFSTSNQSTYLLSQFLLHRCSQRGEDNKQITDNSVTRLLEDGRVGVFVDGKYCGVKWT